MKVGLIGAGHIGGTLARLFAKAGHEVAVSNSRGPETLHDLVTELGARAHAATPEEAAAFGDVVVVSIPFGEYRRVPVEELVGKVVIDTNNYYPQRDGVFAELDAGRTTSSEILQAHLPRARVVKALNTNYWYVLRDRGRPTGAPDRIAVPIAGDDDQAKAITASLLDGIGFDAIDVGPLVEGRRLQPGSSVYTQALSAEGIRSRLGMR